MMMSILTGRVGAEVSTGLGNERLVLEQPSPGHAAAVAGEGGQEEGEARSFRHGGRSNEPR